MSKKVTLSIFAVLGIVFLSGCGKNQEQETTQTQKQEQEQVKIASEDGMENKKRETPPEGGKGGGMMNSEEAITACADLIEGDECSFVVTNESDEEMEMAGTCQNAPQSKNNEEAETSSDELVCMPEMKEGNQRGPGNGMPPQDIEAE